MLAKKIQMRANMSPTWAGRMSRTKRGRHELLPHFTCRNTNWSPAEILQDLARRLTDRRTSLIITELLIFFCSLVKWACSAAARSVTARFISSDGASQTLNSHFREKSCRSKCFLQPCTTNRRKKAIDFFNANCFFNINLPKRHFFKSSRWQFFFEKIN